MNEINFTFSDTIAGYVTRFSREKKTFGLKTSDGREFEVVLSPMVFARISKNLEEGYIDATGRIGDLLAGEGQYVYACGIFYPEGGATKFEAKSLVFPGHSKDQYRHEEPDWWVNQARSIGHSYLRWQFDWPNTPIDYKNYRTILHLAGGKKGDTLQETDTISRMVFGLASTYLLTGQEEYLEGAEKGTEYLRDHMRFYDPDEDLVYWYHGIKVSGDREQKLLTSEFGDDFDSIPMYEQIYALAGPTQTFRITGDPRIRCDIDKTLDLFEKYFKDKEKGGYFSHVDPITFDPRSSTLDKGNNRGKKNWNSVGDHAPAFLINLLLATGEKAHEDFLIYTADTIAKYFPDYENSPFVQEKFFEDWSKDQSWGWQQNRAVVGHNLKIAWNLMRVYHLQAKPEYKMLAEKIGKLMPEVGCDLQRGGWYDMVERVMAPGQKFHRHVWHDRKAWWQQEQGILAYLILNGSLGNEFYLKQARESAAFYNAWFLDHDDGGVYFNTLASGPPYLLGNERLKGCHSMSAYHSIELCYLAAVYTNLLITKQPMDFYFKPQPQGFKDRILRVSPDLLPKGSIKLTAVTVDDKPYRDFDADALTVKLPDSKQSVRVKATITPVKG
jgi:mannose/cellobiose epimerase-like protein (N-acyl-D-glucosamine 2-epimerase family)